MFTEVSKQRHFHLKFGKETGEGAVQRRRSLNFQESGFFLFFKILFIYLTEITSRQRQAERERARGKQAPC